MFSNFLANLPFAWLSLCINQYNIQNHLIPDTQVATQQGVQGHDMTSFLSQLESWSNRTSTPLFILKRDQQKGFDFLSPSGFHDAIQAYGLPQEIISLDESSQSDVNCSIHTTYGDTPPILINGITKQGSSLSTLKLALTTSLGHRWLSEDFGVEIASIKARKHDPHRSSDLQPLKISMVKATDDSLLFASCLSSLWAMCL